MFDRATKCAFNSVLGYLMEQFIREKQNCGYRYDIRRVCHLRDFDRFLVREGWNKVELPKSIVLQWAAKRQHESDSTLHNRVTLLRQFCLFLVRMGIESHIIEKGAGPRKRSDFTARIFTHEEMQRIFVAVDKMPPNNWAPLRHLIMPELFRLLYGCGLRVSEAVRLRVGDTDLQNGILTIRDGKFGKDRLAPLHFSMTERLRAYASRSEIKEPESFFFPSPDGGHYHPYRIYCIFREILIEAGIHHGGRGRGPRLHDLRHTFAVHRLIKWYKEGQDLNAKLPMLATYMGHRGMSGTQTYLQLTAELFPEITERLENCYGYIIPERRREQ